MERYVGQIQSWSSQLEGRTVRGVIYDSARKRGKVGNMAHDFAFVEFTDPDELQDRLAELNR